jgi:hypothetical protein
LLNGAPYLCSCLIGVSHVVHRQCFMC